MSTFEQIECTSCGYHNNNSNRACVRCGKSLDLTGVKASTEDVRLCMHPLECKKHRVCMGNNPACDNVDLIVNAKDGLSATEEVLEQSRAFTPEESEAADAYLGKLFKDHAPKALYPRVLLKKVPEPVTAEAGVPLGQGLPATAASPGEPEATTSAVLKRVQEICRGGEKRTIAGVEYCSGCGLEAHPITKQTDTEIHTFRWTVELEFHGTIAQHIALAPGRIAIMAKRIESIPADVMEHLMRDAMNEEAPTGGVGGAPYNMRTASIESGWKAIWTVEKK